MHHFDTIKQLYRHAYGFSPTLSCTPQDVQRMLIWAEHMSPEMARWYIQLLDHAYHGKRRISFDQTI